MKKRNARRTMKGGFFESLSSLSDSISQGASSLWEKTKNATSSLTTGSSSSNYTSSGGKKTRRRQRGGFHDNTSLTGLASNAGEFSGPSAKPNNVVGGKSKRRRRKSRKH